MTDGGATTARQFIGINDMAEAPCAATTGSRTGTSYSGRILTSEAGDAVAAESSPASDQNALMSGGFEDNPASLGVKPQLGTEVASRAAVRRGTMQRAKV